MGMNYASTPAIPGPQGGIGPTGLTGTGGTTVAPEDFFRSAAGTTLPDGTTDVTDAITRTGNTGLGVIPSTVPVALLDLSRATRTGTDARNAGDALYGTGGSASVNTTVTPETETIADKILLAKFMHTNQTQGIGIGFDGIQAIGSSVNQDLNIKNRGSGTMREIWQNAGQAVKEFRNQGSRLVANCGFRWDWLQSNLVVAREYIYDIAGDSAHYDKFSQLYNSGLRTYARIRRSGLISSAFKHTFSENDLNKDKIVLYNFDSSGEQFVGFGVISGAMTYQTYGNWDHNFYHAPDNTTANLLMQVNADGNVGIGMTAGGLQKAKLDVRGSAVVGAVTTETFRSAAVGANILNAGSPTALVNPITTAEAVFRMYREGTASVSYGHAAEFRIGKYAAGLAQATQLELWAGAGNVNVPSAKVIHFRADGRVNTPSLPLFANEAAAVTGGLVTGDWYRTPAGVLMIKL